MTEKSRSTLTREQWESRDYRQRARELDEWAKKGGGTGAADDSTDYVAKIGLTGTGSVIVMNRAHDQVLVPPPARPILAGFALLEQPFGFTHADLAAVRRASAISQDEEVAAALRSLGDRLEALLPPAAA